MSTSRRSFLRSSAAALGALSATGFSRILDAAQIPSEYGGLQQQVQRAARPLRILILGGTNFIGPHQVRYAQARGHSITLFNRGRTNPGLFTNVETLIGDRNGQLDALRGKRWDAVIDNSATNPRWVRDSATLLKDSANQYLFVSTQGVYASRAKIGMTEDEPVSEVADQASEDNLPYGPSKAAAEREAQKAFAGRATIIRPAVIVGPGDDSDRFTYWPVRIDRGGEVLAPGTASDPSQFIDVRDLCEWTIRMVENAEMGVFNATGPATQLSIGEMLNGIKSAIGSNATFTWVSAEFLAQQGQRTMPMWENPVGDRAGFHRMSNARAIGKGLTFRPLAVTARDTLAWYKPEAEQRIRVAPNAQREAQILAAWKARGG
jgi:2'-hydroxyisoflavone reductase